MISLPCIGPQSASTGCSTGSLMPTPLLAGRPTISREFRRIPIEFRSLLRALRPNEIELIQKENELTVTGRKDAKDEATQFLHRGIATRAFKQSFNLAEHVKVVEASQENGLLVISLKREDS